MDFDWNVKEVDDKHYIVVASINSEVEEEKDTFDDFLLWYSND